MPGIKPEATGRGARMLPLCYAGPLAFIFCLDPGLLSSSPFSPQQVFRFEGHRRYFENKETERIFFAAVVYQRF